MCGDGTNDVAALKMADVGVSVVSDHVAEEIYDRTLEVHRLTDGATSVSNRVTGGGRERREEGRKKRSRGE